MENHVSTPQTDSIPQATPTHPRRPFRWMIWSVCGLLLIGGACLALAVAVDRRTPVQGYTKIKVYPHDREAFTQGLAFDEEGNFYEGTGKPEKSTLRKVDLKTGQVLDYFHLKDIDARIFGEGITVVGDTIVQLTWRRQMGIVYDRKTLKPIRYFQYRGEGWGLTYDGTHLIMSDGSSRLRILDPKTFRVVRLLRVGDGRKDIVNLNELEFVEGEIYANVWHTDRIARISPKTGQVLGWIDLSGLLAPGEVTDEQAVLNGIAYDAKNKKLYVTGKEWPKLFEITLNP
ncbi:MAG: glutaminyl-peptide cyclotransferase [Planctomycetaceae bacterium]|nr:glutaminyl-peptide cyclotransferase [Planctomycetaceae bacterium]